MFSQIALEEVMYTFLARGEDIDGISEVAFDPGAIAFVFQEGHDAIVVHLLDTDEYDILKVGSPSQELCARAQRACHLIDFAWQGRPYEAARAAGAACLA